MRWHNLHDIPSQDVLSHLRHLTPKCYPISRELYRCFDLLGIARFEIDGLQLGAWQREPGFHGIESGQRLGISKLMTSICIDLQNNLTREIIKYDDFL